MMWCGGVAVVVVAACVVVMVVSAAVTGSSSRYQRPFPPPAVPPLSTGQHHSQSSSTVGRRGTENFNESDGSEKSKYRVTTDASAQVEMLRRLKLSPEEVLPNSTAATLTGTKSESEEVRWQCLVEWLRARSKKGQRTCDKEAAKRNGIAQGKSADECVPLLLMIVPALCNGTESCANLTETSLEELLHRYLLWERKKKRQEESDDAMIYIVVVLAFYSFGIVFMIANFVRQEQRELEETKMYKQYVKLARDRWLTTRGNMANRLALQALNTLNAVPQTTDVNKVTFV